MDETCVDVGLLKDFERQLDPRCPERGAIPARILGYGEISTVFELGKDSGLAFKRLPIFRCVDEMERYSHIYREYNRLLADDIGLMLPPHGITYFEQDGRIVCFLYQEKLPSRSIGSRAIHLLPDEGVITLVRLVLRQLVKVWDFNSAQQRYRVGIDGQISNWALAGGDAAGPSVSEDSALYYLDTSTPLYRVDGVEQIDPELFLRSAPSFLVWLIRMLFLEDVVTRYYDFRLVAIDLVANFYKEQRAELIPALLDTVNDFFTSERPDLALAPVTAKEVRAYYREDALIWRLYLGARKLDRFLRTRLTRRGYPYILPGKISR
ncbi:MAG: DUF6206 family protein [Candidatus Geothermincolia bacterium]